MFETFSEQAIIKVRLFSEVRFINLAILNEGNNDFDCCRL